MERNTIYKGKQLWVQVDPEALKKNGEIVTIGDPIVADQSITRVDRSGFEITYLAYLFDVFDQLGGKKYKVFKYIVEHKSSDNTLIITNRELAKAAGVSLKTAQDCISLLKEKGIISVRTGAIMLTPKVAHRGKYGREQYLMHKFEEFDGEEKHYIDEDLFGSLLESEGEQDHEYR